VVSADANDPSLPGALIFVAGRIAGARVRTLQLRRDMHSDAEVDLQISLQFRRC
jgi:hypothetical protein